MRVLFLLFGLSLSLVCAAEDVNPYEYLNKLRIAAGMPAFAYNETLAIAAQNHANYLHIHTLGGHGERYGRRGFTGADHVQRILNVGYQSSQTGENVSYHSGDKGSKDSIDGLMAAIYHRFAFLSFIYDEVGVGRSQSSSFSTHVYNFGNQRKNKLCQLSSYSGLERYNYSVCSDKRFRIASPVLDEAEHSVSKKSASVVVWPAANSKDIPPAFYEEDPDPLPYHDVSGYPVSVQFNPVLFPHGLPTITRFQIFRASDNQPLETILLLNVDNDRSRKFQPNEHALFPLQRLDWNTHYRVEVDYQSAGNQHQLNWVFTTQQMPLPMVTVTRDNQAIQVKSGERFAIYVPPRGPRDGEGSYRTRYASGMKLDIEIYDNHTLAVTVTGQPGRATVTFHGLDIRLEM